MGKLEIAASLRNILNMHTHLDRACYFLLLPISAALFLALFLIVVVLGFAEKLSKYLEVTLYCYIQLRTN